MSRTVDVSFKKKVYQAMIEFQHKTGFNMTLDEISVAVGVKSKTSIWTHVQWLKKHGYVEIHSKQIRAVPGKRIKED